MRLILTEAIVFLCLSCTLLSALSVKWSHPPNIVTKEKCYSVNVSSQQGTCSVKRQPLLKRKLVRIDGKQVFFLQLFKLI